MYDQTKYLSSNMIVNAQNCEFIPTVPVRNKHNMFLLPWKLLLTENVPNPD